MWMEAVVAYLEVFSLEGLRNVRKNLSQDSRCTDRDSNSEHSEYVTSVTVGVT
jgi:hypothetical protein